jgi:hypothetical protein
MKKFNFKKAPGSDLVIMSLYYLTIIVGISLIGFLAIMEIALAN